MPEILINGQRIAILAVDERDARLITEEMCPTCPVGMDPKKNCSRMLRNSGLARLNGDLEDLEATVKQAACKPTYTPTQL